MYLLDTNTCIDFLLHAPPPLVRRVDEHFERLAVSAITVAELRVGKRTSTDIKADDERLNVFLASLDVQSFDEAAAAAYGDLVRSSRMDRKSFDRLIAAHAIALGSTLVTNNDRDFADIVGLRVQNWTV